jgi:hypothetical protein
MQGEGHGHNVLEARRPQVFRGELATTNGCLFGDKAVWRNAWFLFLTFLGEDSDYVVAISEYSL